MQNKSPFRSFECSHYVWYSNTESVQENKAFLAFWLTCLMSFSVAAYHLPQILVVSIFSRIEFNIVKP